MCGRFARTTSGVWFAHYLNAQPPVSDDGLGINIPPGGFRLCALQKPGDEAITLGSAWWGLIPSGARTAEFAPINARYETADKKQPFTRAFQQRHCVVCVDWWYEWARGSGGKQPYALRPADGQPFCLAAIWTQAKALEQSHEASNRVTFAILTCTPTPSLAEIHSRQPIALTREGARDWMTADPDAPSQAHRALLDEGRVRDYEYWPVAKRIGNVKNTDSALAERVIPD